MPTPATFSFESDIIVWRGPSPFFFAAVPAQDVAAIRHAARIASYGWGVVPVEAEIGGTAFGTSLFPREGGYLLPIKAAVRSKLDLGVGDTVRVRMTIRMPR